VGGVTDFSAKGLGDTLFLGWEKEKVDERRVERSILTTFVPTKAQKRLKLTVAIY
jgi:hypothetical protein